MDFSMNILVVDDMVSMRRIIMNALKRMGFKNIIVAEDGAMAYKELTRGNFQLIISDWNMPNMDGLELLKKVRSTDVYEGLPFIMVTAEGQKENVVKAVKAGVSQYIVKPFTNDQLSKKIKNIFL